jgi:hypothetical protein
MPRGKPFRNDLDPGRVINCAQRFVQLWHAADGVQRPLRSRCPPRPTPSIGRRRASPRCRFQRVSFDYW